MAKIQERHLRSWWGEQPSWTNKRREEMTVEEKQQAIYAEKLLMTENAEREIGWQMTGKDPYQTVDWENKLEFGEIQGKLQLKILGAINMHGGYKTQDGKFQQLRASELWPEKETTVTRALFRLDKAFKERMKRMQDQKPQ